LIRPDDQSNFKIINSIYTIMETTKQHTTSNDYNRKLQSILYKPKEGVKGTN